MGTDDCRIEEDRPQADDVLLLQFLQHAINHPCLAPALEAGVDGVPVTVFLRQLPPGAAGAEQVENGIENLSM